jgi:ubiquinone/menaquinone biosynthesis C-methylase UbiE
VEDLYKKFAYDYDEFGKIEDYLGKEKEFFEKIFAKYSVNTVLDCACGTGQHLYMLSQIGKAVAGSDYSESMLDVCQKNLSEKNINIPLKQCDYRYIESVFPQKFDAILCLTNSLSHMQTNEDLTTALTSMFNCIGDNGILVLTSGTTYWTLMQTPAIETVVNRADFSRIFVKEQNNDFLTIHILDLYHSSQRTESNQYDMRYKILYENDYINLLKKVGFRNTHIYGNYDMDRFEKMSSKRIIVVAEK